MEILKTGGKVPRVYSVNAPTVADAGYPLGTEWVHALTANTAELYLCNGNTVGAAVWNLGGVANPLVWIGDILVATDFPTLAEVQNGWFYTVSAVTVIDNDPTRTNTGQTFVAGDEIVWNAVGLGWTIVGSLMNHAILINRDSANQHPATAITNTPAGTIVATQIQAAIDELDTKKIPRIVSVNKVIARYDGITGSLQGYTSNSPTVSDEGLGDFPGGFGGDRLYLDQNVEVLAADKTLVVGDKVIQKFNPDGVDRNVLFPATASATDLIFIIYNTADETGENLILPDGLEIHDGEAAFCSCDGSAWLYVKFSCYHGALELDLPVKEENTIAIEKGQVCYISGATGTAYPNVGLANCNNPAKLRAKGLAILDIGKNKKGLIREKGLLEGVDSSKATGHAVNPNDEDWVAGDQLWADLTNGGITNARPLGRSIKVGTALTAEGVSSKILIDIRENEIWCKAAAGEDVVLAMGDDIGANKVTITNHSGVEVAFFDSLGGFSGNIKDFESLYVEEGLDDAANPPEASEVLTSTNKVIIRNFAGGVANESLLFYWKPKGDLTGTTIRFRFAGFVTNATAPAEGETIIFTLSGSTGALGTAQGTAQSSTYTAPAAVAQYDGVEGAWSTAITIANLSATKGIFLYLTRDQANDTYAQDFGQAVFDVEFSRTLAG